FQVVFSEDEPRDYADLLRADRERGIRFGLACLEHGLFVNPGEKFYVSLAHTDDDVDRTLEVFAHALEIACATSERGATTHGASSP
ncbi:MAG: aspartate aminotransferase family protein, partial [Thermomicrobium sp.]|nr:aspartate aminotransferase family protein [Thermomicrobium sp.]